MTNNGTMPSMARTEYLHQRMDGDLKQAFEEVAQDEYGTDRGAMAKKLNAMMLKDEKIKARYKQLKEQRQTQPE